jgi:hypothetical protein
MAPEAPTGCRIAAVNAVIGNPDGLLNAANNYCFYNSVRPSLYLTWDNDIVFLDSTVEADSHAPGRPESYPDFGVVQVPMKT